MKQSPFARVRSASMALALLASLGPGARAVAGDPTLNGDVNGSGGIDLTDAMYTLNFLFLGGPPPLPITLPTPGEGEEPAARFEGDLLKPLDLERAAADQYGLGAELVSTGEHLYDWKVRVRRDLVGLDLEQAVADQYGSGYRLVAVGVHRYDWRAIRLADVDHAVLPVMLIASDRFFDVAGVRRAVERYRSVLGRVQGWYGLRTGAWLRMLQPLVVVTGRTGAEWDSISASTAMEAHRFDLIAAAIEACEASLPAPGENLRMVLSPYTGESADVWLGAASTGRYAVAPQRATSLDCPAAGPLNALSADAAYAIGHELGHTFGLAHSCDAYPESSRCGDSILQTGKPPEAILLQREVCALLESPFFQEEPVIPHLDRELPWHVD